MESSSSVTEPMRLINPLKARLKEGKPVFGIMATQASVGLIQLLARAGFDYVKIDLEHSPIDMTSLHSMIAATSGSSCTPVVRVPQSLPWVVKQVLDLGAMGICFPLIHNAEEAQAALRSTLYAPEGIRGWGPFYSSVRWGVSMLDYVQQANEQVMTELLIEHEDAVEHIEEIVKIPGIDSAFIAPQDLAASLGHRGHPEHPRVREYIHRAEEAILRSNVALGGLSTSPEQTRLMLERGYRVLTLGFDFMLIQRGAEQMLRGLAR